MNCISVCTNTSGTAIPYVNAGVPCKQWALGAVCSLAITAVRATDLRQPPSCGPGPVGLHCTPEGTAFTRGLEDWPHDGCWRPQKAVILWSQMPIAFTERFYAQIVLESRFLAKLDLRLVDKPDFLKWYKSNASSCYMKCKKSLGSLTVN